MSEHIPYLDRLGDAFRDLRSKRSNSMSRTKRRGVAVAAGVVLVGAALVGVVVAGSFWGSSEQPKDRVAGQSSDPASGAARDVRSERAWAQLSLTGAEEVEHFLSLGPMTSSASAVVRAQVVRVEPGRTLGLDDAAGGGAIQYVSVFLEPTSILSSRGDIVTDSSGLVELELGPVETDFDVESFAKEITGDEVLAFLRLKGSVIPEVNNPERTDELALGVYRLVSSQGLFLNSGGTAQPALYGDDGFPRTLEGEPFAELVTETRAAA